MLPDEFAEEGEAGKVELGADFLDRLIAVAQLLADGGGGGLMDEIERRTARLVFHAFGEIFGCDIQHIGKD